MERNPCEIQNNRPYGIGCVMGVSGDLVHINIHRGKIYQMSTLTGIVVGAR